MPSSADDLKMPQVYLAGPDIFFPDAAERYARLKAACRFVGLRGVAPNDGLEISAVGGDLSSAIYAHNMRLLRSSAAVLANLSSFRGLEPDSGTVFEAADAHAMGIPVAGYTLDALTLVERHRLHRKGDVSPSGDLVDREDGGYVENFGLPANLMLACAFPIVPTPQKALERLVEMLAVAAGVQERVAIAA